MADEYQEYTVAQGDDLLSIALQFRMSADAIWNDPKNRERRESRKEAWREQLGSVPESPFVLEPGDILWIPAWKPKTVSIATDRRHTFRQKGLKSKLLLYLQKDDKPRAGLAYTIDIDGSLHLEGKTDGDGKIEQWIPVNARIGTLKLQREPLTAEEREERQNGPFADDDDADEPEFEFFDLQLGQLDPVSTDKGQRVRLFNLGFLDDLEADDAAIAEALEDFQRHSGLTVTGKVSETVLSKLVEQHGS